MTSCFKSETVREVVVGLCEEKYLPLIEGLDSTLNFAVA